MSSRVEATVSWLTETPTQKETSHFACAFNGGDDHFIYRYNSSDGPLEERYTCILGWNPDYSFKLTSRGSADLVVEAIMPNRDRVTNELEIRNEVFAAVMVDRIPIGRLVALPGFRVMELDVKGPPGQRELHLGFQVSEDDSPEQGYAIEGGALTLLPDSDYAVAGYRVDAQFSGEEASVVGSTEYDDESIMHGLPRRHRVVVETIDASGLRQRETTYESIASGTAARSECRLSAFHLPEPANFKVDQGRQRFLLLALNVVVVLAIVAAIVLRRLAATH